MSLTFNEILGLQERFDKAHMVRERFYEHIGPENITSLEHLIVCLVGEVGEFSNIVKKVRRGDFSFDNKRAELSEELADIFIYLIKIAYQCEFDLEAAFLEKHEKNKSRFKRVEE